MPGPNETTLRIGGTLIQGWTSVRVTRGIERFPSDFTIGVTEKYPGEPAAAIREGAECQLLLGERTVVTGYIDDVDQQVDDRSHAFTVTGRSKCMDLIDCSAEIEQFKGQMQSSTVLDMASKLCAPYGITVRDLTQQSDTIGGQRPTPLGFRDFTINLGETPYEIIERVARSVGLLIYDDTDGNLVLATAVNGELPMASGIAEGVNAKRFGYRASVAQRYGSYVVFRNALETQQDTEAALQRANEARSADTGTGATGDPANPYGAFTEVDVGMRRNRRLFIIGEQVQGSVNYTKLRATWERNYRAGRGNVVYVTVDSWHDVQGRLWQPNALVRFQLPSVKLHDRVWLISEVTYQRDDKNGTTADLTLMPPEAFDVRLTPLDNYNEADRDAALAQSLSSLREQQERAAREVEQGMNRAQSPEASE